MLSHEAAIGLRKNNTLQDKMKLLLNIDQTASLIAGLDAPSSTMVIDINPASIPAEIRAKVLAGYDVATGKITVDTPPSVERGYAHMSAPILSTVLSNATETEAIAALVTLAADIDAMHAEHASKVAEHKVSEARKAEEAEAKIQATIAGLLDGSIKIAWEVTNGGINPASGPTITADRMTPELTTLLEKWKADKAEVERLKAEKEAEAKAAREAHQIKGRDWHAWDIDQGTIDISEEPGVPYDSHSRAKNWLATVTYGGSKGKLNRSFWGGRGKNAEIPGNLEVGDYIEGGSKDKKGRNEYKYVRVLKITDEVIYVRESGTPGDVVPDVTAEVEKLEGFLTTAE